MAAHAPLYCRTPPRSTGGLCATVLPRSAALYYCRGPPRRAIMAAWTAVYCREPPRCTGGLSAAFLPQSAALYSLALLLAQSSLPRCAGGLFSAPIFVKYEIPRICISFLWLKFIWSASQIQLKLASWTCSWFAKTETTEPKFQFQNKRFTFICERLISTLIWFAIVEIRNCLKLP